MAISSLLVFRMSDLAAGRATAADVAFAVLWFALVLVPIFSEIKFGSIVELKQHIEEVKEEVTRDVRLELAEFKLDIRNAVDVRANISPQINFPAPPRDDQLPEIEERIRLAVARQLGRDPNEMPRDGQQLAPVPAEVRLLFETRYLIEVELRRIAEHYGFRFSDDRPPSGLRLANAMSEIIPKSLMHAIREVYSVCSPAIHGAAVTKAQVAFVQETGPWLVNALKGPLEGPKTVWFDATTAP